MEEASSSHSESCPCCLRRDLELPAPPKGTTMNSAEERVSAVFLPAARPASIPSRRNGSRRQHAWKWAQFCLPLLLLIVGTAEGCSTRPSPKPRPPRPFWHPNENLPRRPCPDDYAELYCLHNGTCFMQASARGDDRPFCVCLGSHYGRRCEFLEVSVDKWLPITGQKAQMETAAISVAVTFLVFLTCLVSLAAYVYRKRQKTRGRDVHDGSVEEPRPFSIRRAQHYVATRKPVHDSASELAPVSAAAFAEGALPGARRAAALGHCLGCRPELRGAALAADVAESCPRCSPAPIAEEEEVRVKDSVRTQFPFDVASTSAV